MCEYCLQVEQNAMRQSFWKCPVFRQLWQTMRPPKQVPVVSGNPMKLPRMARLRNACRPSNATIPILYSYFFQSERRVKLTNVSMSGIIGAYISLHCRTYCMLPSSHMALDWIVTTRYTPSLLEATLNAEAPKLTTFNDGARHHDAVDHE